MTAGRPTVMTTEIIDKLETAFSMGCTDIEACCYAGIGISTLYDYQRENEKFSDRKKVLKKTPVLKARQAMLDMLKSKDEQIKFRAASDTLNRYDGKATERIELTGKDGAPLKTINHNMTPKEAAQAFKDQIKDI